jgi:hypothetical protein
MGRTTIFPRPRRGRAHGGRAGRERTGRATSAPRRGPPTAAEGSGRPEAGPAGLITRAGREEDRRTASLRLTAAGEVAVGRWQRLNEELLRTALTALAQPTRGVLDAALPALRELAGAIDALADAPPGELREPHEPPGPWGLTGVSSP